MSILLSAGDRSRLKALDEAPAGEWARATWCMSAMYALVPPMSDEDIAVNWQKLAGRRSEDVREVLQELREARPEMRQYILTRFAKEHEEIRRKSA